jgi:hypothetical protein
MGLGRGEKRKEEEERGLSVWEEISTVTLKRVKWPEPTPTKL